MFICAVCGQIYLDNALSEKYIKTLVDKKPICKRCAKKWEKEK